ncbi:Wzz/FepE/Etk N-terminal domain-containing protein [Neobacillus sp. 179-C4.2 HS]|uniref:Wzz/FepE/Etk N-terminal domain-containing protein n=1 Tax=Neobacillus driksii TaxID=3035913 RepID=A0ABV4Z2V8_9BACI|nr:Wzz/FepE/Etk N-terminal domain-containing protein [Neobacillus sp. 179.-C4.2 HS]MDP5195994.1 Wzz/FepE/Etk N-terminal domain-containing protein [Neobacillus sp. 179.-C4.2 HS]
MRNIDQIQKQENQKVKDINLKELFFVIKRRFWIIMVSVILASIIGAYLSNISITPLYQTSSRIIIGADAESQKTLQVIIKDSTILDKVIKELNLDKSAEELAGQISVASIDGSQVVSISVVDSDPILAAKIADKTAQIFKNEVPNIVGQDYIRLLSNAKVNTTPINQENNNKLYLAIIAGIVVGVGFAFLIESFDDRIRSEKEIEAIFGVQVLGKISKMNKRNIKKKKNGHLEIELRGETIGYK